MKSYKYQKMQSGSFTVEAAMIMGIVLFVILSVLGSARMIYNKTLQIAHAYEISITDREQDMAGLWGESADEDISIKIEELKPVPFLWKSKWIRKEVEG